MASDETGWTKELPTADGYYWRRDYDGEPEPELVEVVGHEVCYVGLKSDALAEWAHCQWLGPLSPSDAEQLMELRWIAKKLIEAAQFSLLTPGFIKGRDELEKYSESMAAALNPLQKERQ